MSTNVSSTGIPDVTVRTTSFSSLPLNQLLNQITTIKLDRGNSLFWKNLALPILRSYKLERYLSGAKPCPPKYTQQPNERLNAAEIAMTEGASSSDIVMVGASSSDHEASLNPQYEVWIAVDQLLLGWLYNSMTLEVATQVMGFEHAKDIWEAIQVLFRIQSRAEEDYLRQIFQQTRKGNLKMIEYLRVMKNHADNLGQAGSPITMRNLISQVLLGLDEEYNPVVAMTQEKLDTSWPDLQEKLLVFEKRLELQNAHKSAPTFNHATL